MVKSQFFAGMMLIGLSAGLTACHEDIFVGKGQGGITPSIELNTGVVSSLKAQARSGEEIGVGDLSLTISSVAGDYSKTWESVSDYPADTKFSVGEYLVEAKYGDVAVEGFECPAYYGSQKVLVRENETTPVSLTASLANSMVSITYTEDFMNYMSDWDATVHSSGGGYVYYTAAETRPGYIAPGAASLNVWIKKPNGQEATLKVSDFTARARYHHHILVNINNGSGSGNAVMVVTFDDTLQQEEVEIELSDELFNAPAPVISSEDITNGSVFNHVSGDEWSVPAKLNVDARGGLKSLTVTTDSKTLKSMGWPEEVDLMKIDNSTRARLEQLGFTYKKESRFAMLDFTNLLANICNEADQTHVFTINANDENNKTCDPFSFAIKNVPLELRVSDPSVLLVGFSELSFDLTYNGNAPQSVAFETNNDRGTWSRMETVSIEPTADGTLYKATVKVPGDAAPVTLRAAYNKSNSDAITVERVIPEYSLSVDDNNVWATKADIKVACENVPPAKLAKLLTLYAATEGGDYAVIQSETDGEFIIAKGLTPSTKYYVKASVVADVDKACAPVSFTTEAAPAVPNGDFENLSQTVSVSNMLQGGQWSVSAGINYDSTVSFAVSEPDGWTSVNKKTTSGSTRNSWFVIPSTFNTTLSYSSTVPKIRVIGTGGGTDTPASYKNFKVKSGSNAMVIRNVAWDPSGSRPSVWRKLGISADEYYNHTEAGTSRVSVGKLFLGSYDYNGGTETYNEGVLFAGRPSALTGWYTYTRDKNDATETGLVEVQVLNGDAVIGSGTAALNPASDMQQFTVKVNYIPGAPKATSVRIMLASSNHASKNQADETANVKVSTFMSRYESFKHGATLVVDALEFVY